MHELYPYHIYPMTLNPNAPRYLVGGGVLMLCLALWSAIDNPENCAWGIMLIYSLGSFGLATFFQLNNIILGHEA
jgi:hypothetical protein